MVPADKEPSARTLLASNLEKLRRARGWSQEDLAVEAGLSASYIAAVEAAQQEVTVIRLEKLANALNVPVSELLSDNLN